MYALRTCSQCCATTLETHRCGLLDYVHAYAAYKVWRGGNSSSWPYVEKTQVILTRSMGVATKANKRCYLWVMLVGCAGWFETHSASFRWFWLFAYRFFLEIFQRGGRSIDRHPLNLKCMCLEHALSSDILLSCSSCIETTKILCGQLDVRCTTCRRFD